MLSMCSALLKGLCSPTSFSDLKSKRFIPAMIIFPDHAGPSVHLILTESLRSKIDVDTDDKSGNGDRQVAEISVPRRSRLSFETITMHAVHPPWAVLLRVGRWAEWDVYRLRM